MAPEYGATCVIFPIDDVTLRYLRFTGRDEAHVALVEAYAKEQGLFHRAEDPEPVFSELVTLDLSTVVPSLAGPSRPQDRVALTDTKSGLPRHLERRADRARARAQPTPGGDGARSTGTRPVEIADGHVVIAAITSCTNTSNPQVMLAAGLLAQKAVARGLRSKPWVKTSLAPGSRVVMDYYERAGLREPLETLGFQLVGFGCTTCIGNSGPLLPGVSEAVHDGDLSVAAVLSGNRNFEGRIHPDVRLNYLASPPLVVAYALAGTMDLDLTTEPLGTDSAGQPVYLRDLWPTPTEVAAAIEQAVTSEMFRTRYGSVFEGDDRWKDIATSRGDTFSWDDRFHLCLEAALLRPLQGRAAPRSPTSSARGCWRSSATASPPTTSPPPGRSGPARRPASTSPSTASSRRSSTPTERVAAITRS